MTVQEAWAETLELLGWAHKGEDPAGSRAGAYRTPTVADLADRHIGEHAKLRNKPKSVQRDRRAWDRCVLPVLGRRKVHSVTRADIAKLMTSMSGTPAMANKVLTLLSKAFNLAEVWEWRPDDPGCDCFCCLTPLQRMKDLRHGLTGLTDLRVVVPRTEAHQPRRWIVEATRESTPPCPLDRTEQQEAVSPPAPW